MARSTLPPIVWVASCGHRNEVRSEHGGYPTKCKMCGASVWVPKRGAGRAPSAREAAGRFGSGRSAAAGTRTADRPPRHAGFGDEADAEAMGEAAGRDRTVAQAAEAAVGRVTGDLARIAGRQPAGRPGKGALSGVPIPPPPPAAPQSATPRPVLMIRAEPAAPLQRGERGPRFGQHLVPQAGPWCEVCSLMGWRNGSGHFARATVALETQRDGRILVCGNCTARIRKMFPGEVLSARKLPARPGPPRIGTVYRPAAPRQQVARCGWCEQRAGTSPCPGCVRRELAVPRTAWLPEGSPQPGEQRLVSGLSGIPARRGVRPGPSLLLRPGRGPGCAAGHLRPCGRLVRPILRGISADFH